MPAAETVWIENPPSENIYYSTIEPEPWIKIEKVPTLWKKVPVLKRDPHPKINRFWSENFWNEFRTKRRTFIKKDKPEPGWNLTGRKPLIENKINLNGGIENSQESKLNLMSGMTCRNISK